MNTDFSPRHDSLSTCRRYGPGHDVFYLQILRDTRLGTPVRTATFVRATRDSFTLRFDTDGEELTLWTHEPERLADCVKHLEGQDPEILLVDDTYVKFSSTRINAGRTSRALYPLTEPRPCQL